MKSIHILSFVILCAIAISIVLDRERQPRIDLAEISAGERYFYGAEVLRVIDGDTIEVRVDLGFQTYREETLRLAGIDTPEVRGESKEEGLRASQWLQERIDQAETVEIRTLKDEQGSFSRYLAILFLDGENVNQQMIDEGLAAPYER